MLSKDLKNDKIVYPLRRCFCVYELSFFNKPPHGYEIKFGNPYIHDSKKALSYTFIGDLEHFLGNARKYFLSPRLDYFRSFSCELEQPTFNCKND